MEGGKAEKAGSEAEVQQRVSGVLVAMETGQAKDRQSSQSGSYAFAGATGTPTSHLAGIHSPSESLCLSSLAYPEDFHNGFTSRPRHLSPLELGPLPEPQLLRLRPTSLRTQDISHLLTGVFRKLYTAEVIGDDLSTNFIKARGSEDTRHEEFVDELQQVTRPRALPTGVHPGCWTVARADRAGDPGRARRKAASCGARLLDKCPHLSGARSCSRHRGCSWAKAKTLPQCIRHSSGRTL